MALVWHSETSTIWLDIEILGEARCVQFINQLYSVYILTNSVTYAIISFDYVRERKKMYLTPKQSCVYVWQFSIMMNNWNVVVDFFRRAMIDIANETEKNYNSHCPKNTTLTLWFAATSTWGIQLITDFSQDNYNFMIFSFTYKQFVHEFSPQPKCRDRIWLICFCKYHLLAISLIIV